MPYLSANTTTEASVRPIPRSRYRSTTLRAEATSLYDHETWVHYAVYTGEDCIDIVSALPPTVTRMGG